MTIRERSHLQDIVRIDSADIRGDFIRLDRNERVLPIGDEEFSRVMAVIGPEVLSSYPDPKPLNQAFARSCGLPESHVVATNGSDAAIRRAFHAFLEPGERVIHSDPSYAMYSVYADVFEAESVAVPYAADLKVPVAGYRAALEQGARLVSIVNPDQPTGATWDLGELRSLIEDARARNTVCLVDETYFPCHPETIISWVQEYDNLIITRSLSKAYGLGGLRIGFAVAQPQLIEAMGKVRGLHEVNSMAIALGCYYLEHPELIERYLDTLREGRKVLVDFARQHNFAAPECPTNFQLLDLDEQYDPGEIISALKGRGFLIKGAYKAPAIRNCLRVTLDGPDLMQQFVTAFERVLASAEPAERTS
ncbi:MAG: aminotransferase class I/II-fold pyridoxal phosphate-dependent enzyme [Alphaproteobacteria bacterium]|nr:aminotransferase class I/II-fold pyridoxal phosphate-dependent enzyme [Alphaproteobacteria bacterium]